MRRKQEIRAKSVPNDLNNKIYLDGVLAIVRSPTPTHFEQF